MYLPVVSIASSVVASGTVVFVVVLAPGLTVVPGPAGCCFEFLDLVFTTADGVVGFGFLVVLESMLLGFLTEGVITDGELEMVVVGLATVVFWIIGVVGEGDGTCIVVITSDIGLFVDCFRVNVFPPTVAELGMVVPDDKAALTNAMLLNMIVITENERFNKSDC